MNYLRSIEEVAETLQNAKARGRACTLLIGAGCSVKAAIPTAVGFVQVIKDRYPHAFQRAESKTYPRCMSELLLSERRDLIAEYVDRAKINWAHVCIALLMQAGFVDRVLTTNFDLLVVRACALLGEFPAIYDFAASQLFKAPDIPGKAVIYLHGQRTGFILINTEEDFRRHSQLLGPYLRTRGAAGCGSSWVTAVKMILSSAILPVFSDSTMGYTGLVTRMLTLPGMFIKSSWCKGRTHSMSRAMIQIHSLLRYVRG